MFGRGRSRRVLIAVCVLCPRTLSFQRPVREIASDFRADLKFASGATQALLEATEAHLSEFSRLRLVVLRLLQRHQRFSSTLQNSKISTLVILFLCMRAGALIDFLIFCFQRFSELEFIR